MSSERSVLSRLRELIAALDRRRPHLDRAHERDIARDAALLKTQAEERIAQLERRAQPPVAVMSAAGGKV